MKKIILNKEHIYQGNLILINREYGIRKKVEYNNLKPFNNLYSNILFDDNANLELQRILTEIKAGNKIVPVSAYRSL